MILTGTGCLNDPLMIAQSSLTAGMALADVAGFLPTRASFMLDFVCLAMIGIVVVMGISIGLVRKGKFHAHKRIQITTAIILLATILAFEIDMRFVTDWRTLAEPSPWYASGLVDLMLSVHLMFAIPTPLVWIVTLVQALRKFPDPPRPGAHSGSHRRWGWASVILMNLTAVTGWMFYWVAFVA